MRNVVVVFPFVPVTAQKPFGRLLDPPEVARAVAFLASAESGLMTGSIVDFDQQVLGAGDSPAALPER